LVSALLLLLLAGDLAGAERALQAGEPERALELLGDLADADSVDPRVYAVQGRALLAMGEPRGAVEPLLRASDALPEDKALARDAAMACWRSADGAHARLYLEDARRMARRTGDGLLVADLDYAAADYEQALAGYRALEPSPEQRLVVLDRIAECLRRLGREPEAKQAFGDVLEEALARGDLAMAYRAAFAADRAGRLLSWLDAKIKAEPENVEAHLYRGYARSEALMFAEAIDDLRFALERRPQLEIKDRLAHVLLQQGVRAQDPALVAEAERLSQEVLDEQPSNQAAWERLDWSAGTHAVNGDVQRAYELLSDLHRRDPEDVRTGLNLCAMARRLGHYEEARGVFEGLLEVSPDDPDVLNDYAILLDGMGDHQQAVALWEKALADEPDNLNALENLFTHHWERGDRAETKEFLERGLEAARAQSGPVARWLWFADRMAWAPAGFGE